MDLNTDIHAYGLASQIHDGDDDGRDDGDIDITHLPMINTVQQPSGTDRDCHAQQIADQQERIRHEIACLARHLPERDQILINVVKQA